MFRHQSPAAWTFHRHSCHPAPPETVPTPTVDPASPPAPPVGKRYQGVPTVDLPAADLPATALAAAVAGRLSCRRFAGSPLEARELAILLKAAYGVVGEATVAGLPLRERTVASAGGRYPLEVYVLLHQVEGVTPAVYHYQPAVHCLEMVRGPLPPGIVARLFLDQPGLAGASAVVVVTATVASVLARYGERGYRYILLEAGHLTQNLGLAAAALAVGGLELGAFDDDQIAAVLGLDLEVEIPVHAVALGRLWTQDRGEVRIPACFAQPASSPTPAT